jgi:hypothetical protein
MQGSEVMPDMKTLFLEFCDPESTRYCLSEPFVQNGFLCATDGRIAVQARCDEADTEGKFPKMSFVIDQDAMCETKWEPSDIGCGNCGGKGSTTTTKCHECKGSGVCENCSGSGEETCLSCDRDHECDECDGSGNCHECDGDGIVEQYECGCVQCESSSVAIPDGETVRQMAWKIARKINTLRNVRYTLIGDDGTRRLIFEADGGIRGCAMFLKKDA